MFWVGTSDDEKKWPKCDVKLVPLIEAFNETWSPGCQDQIKKVLISGVTTAYPEELCNLYCGEKKIISMRARGFFEVVAFEKLHLISLQVARALKLLKLVLFKKMVPVSRHFGSSALVCFYIRTQFFFYCSIFFHMQNILCLLRRVGLHLIFFIQCNSVESFFLTKYVFF